MDIQKVNDIITVVETNAVADWRNSKGVLRYGQCLFNSLYSIEPEIANLIRGTENDPFYIDERIPKFFTALEDFLLEKAMNE